MDDDVVTGSADSRRGALSRQSDDRSVVAIRLARPDDAPAIAAFQTQCWREAYRGLVPQSYLDRVGVSERERSWSRRLVHATREVAIAELHGQVVGVVSWRAGATGDPPTADTATGDTAPGDRAIDDTAPVDPSPDDSETGDLPALELASLYVAAPQRGTGLAADLLRRALGSAPAFLWVFADNPRATAFYANHGFQPDGATMLDPGTGLAEQRLLRR